MGRLMENFIAGSVWYNRNTNHLYAIISVTENLVMYFTPYDKDIRHKALKEFQAMYDRGALKPYANI